MGKGVRGVDGKWVGGDELRRRSEVHRQSPHRATGLAQGWITWSVPWHESPILAPADALLGDAHATVWSITLAIVALSIILMSHGLLRVALRAPVVV
jgi:hypothetical protein